MAIKSGDYYKAKVEEYTAVANAIKVLMGQPQFGSDNYTDKYAYEWTTDYIAKLTQLKTILDRLNDIIGDDDSAEHRYFTIEDDEWVEIYPTPEDLELATTEPIDVDPVEDEVPTEEYTEGTIYVLDNGPIAEIESKIEDILDEINEILDPNHEEEDKTINEGIEDIKDLISELDDILDGDSTDETDSLEDIVDEFIELIDILEDTIDPDGNTDNQVDRPFTDTVQDIVDTIEKGHLAEDILKLVEELIEYGLIASDTDHGYRPIVEGEEGTHIWDSDINAYRVADEDEIPTHVISEEYEFFAEDHDLENFQDILDFIGDKADEAFAKVEEAEELYEGETEDPYYRPAQEGEKPKYVWDDEEGRYRLPEDDETPTHVKTLNEAEELAILLDDLLEAIENITALLNEYRYGDFQIIEVTTEKQGTGITDFISYLETARRNTMSNRQKEIEKTVVYVTRCLFNANESFICSFLVDGVRKEGVFIWKNNIDTAINQSVPNTKARLSAGKYLIRIVLKQMLYYWSYDSDKGRYVWKTIASHLVPEDKTIETVTDLPNSGAANTYYLISK